MVLGLGLLLLAGQGRATAAEDGKGNKSVAAGQQTLAEQARRQKATLPDALEFRDNALASALAEILAVCICHPLDTAKARLQNPGSQLTSIGEALTETARSEGVWALYRGLGTVLTIGTPAFVLYLGSYEVCKALLLSWLPASEESVAYFIAGIAAEAVSGLLYVPVDVIKERLQVQGASVDDPTGPSIAYQGTWDALQTIKRTEGLAGIYRGYDASLLSFGPYSAIYFVFYEQFKVLSAAVGGMGPVKDEADIPFYLILLSAAVAGALASWITNPLDLVRLRLQVQRGLAASSSTGGGIVPYANTWDGLVRIFKEEGGVKGLYKGSWARIAFFTPSTMISMSTYDWLKAAIHHLLSATT